MSTELRRCRHNTCHRMIRQVTDFYDGSKVWVHADTGLSACHPTTHAEPMEG